MKLNYKIFILILAPIIFLLAFLYLKQEKKNHIIYKTEKLAKGRIQEKVTSTGTINPISNIIIGSSISGIIKEIYVDFNSKVKKGQLLATIDPEPYLAQVEQAKANLLIAEVNLEKAKVSLLEAQNNYKRYSKLYEEKLISDIEYERYLFLLKTAQAQTKEAEAKVIQAKAALRQANTNLKYTKIRSPINGIVISKNIEIGQTVTASFQSPNLFIIAEDLSKMQIHTSIDESDIAKIKVGQKAYFTIDAYPEKILEGKVVQIRNAPNIIQNVVTYDVIINIENQSYNLKPGMTAQVTILTQEKDNVFIVKNSALRIRISTEEMNTTPFKKKLFERPGIYILENEKPRRMEVETGISDGEYTEIKAKDLKENLNVILEIIDTPKLKKSLF